MSHKKYGRWYVPFLLLWVFVLYSISYADVTPVADRTPQVHDAIVAAVPGVDSAADVTAEHLSTITSLTLRLLKITSLASGDFSGLTGLTSLNLYGNQLSSLPAGVFEGLTSLTTLRLGRNTVDPLPLTVSLEKVAEGEFKAVVPAGATFDIVLPITVVNGSITGSATEITIPQGRVESDISLTVTRTPGTIGTVTVDIGTLPSLPRNHYGYALTKSDALPLTIITGINTDPVTDVQEVVPVETPYTAPTFAEGNITIRTIAENVSAGTNIGVPVTATDGEDDTLTWTLNGIDAAAFTIDSTTGQLKTKVPLDYETKRVYSVSLTVADEELSDTITVIISVIDVSDTVIAADVFPVIDRTPQVRDAIVAAIPTVRDATQVTATNLASITVLNLRSKGIPALKTGDFSGLAALTYLNLTGNQLSSLPVGTFDGLRALTTLRLGGNVLDPLPLIVSLQQVRDSEYRAIIPTGAPFPIRIPITVTDGSIRGGITSVVVPQGRRHSAFFTVVGTSAKVSLGMLPGVPRNHYGYVLAQSTVSSRTEQIATAIAAAIGVSDSRSVTETDLATITSLDLSGTSLTTLKTGDFADLVSLTTLNLSNNALTNLPAGIFDDTPSLRSITLANNQLSNLPAGLFTGLSFLSTVDLSGNGITSLSDGTFSELSALTTINLANNKLSTLPAGIFEGLTSLNQLSLNGNTVDPLQIGVSLQKVGTNQFKAVVPTGAPFNIVLPLEQINGTVRGGATTIQIPKGSVESHPLTMIRIPNTIAAVEVDIVNVPQLPSNHNGYALVKSMTRRLEVLPKLNSPPMFTEGTSTIRTVLENTGAGRNIGDPITATDVDRGNTLTYTLGGIDAASFNVDSTTGQLRTKATLDYETKTSYSVVLTVSDGLATDTIAVAINVTDVDENRAPVFTEGNSTTRTVAENTDPRTNIGDPVSATDADEDTLTYRLSGTDAAAFAIDTSSGQLQTNALLDYETKSSHTVTLTVSDGKLTDTITVTINVTDVPEITVIEKDEPEDSAQQQKETNNPPVFTDGTSTTRSIAEDTAPGQNIGSAVSATDTDSGDKLTYTLGGIDANAFSIDSTTGQLHTSAGLDYETKNSYSVTISVSDGKGATDSITVTINVTDVSETTITLVSERTSQVRDGIVAAVPGVSSGADVTAAHLTAITSLDLSDQSISSLKADDFSGLTSLTWLDLSYNSISDISALSGLASLTWLNLYGNSISDISALSRLTSLTSLNLYDNSASDISALSGLTSLTWLALSGNSISDISALSGLTSLTTLNLAINSISDISALSDLTSLIILHLAINSISDISALSDLTSLTWLNLSDNSISDISALEDLTVLTYLNLSSNSISDISALSGLTSLPTLHLSNNSISDISALEDLTSLTRLHLSNNSISDISALEDLTSLTTLRLSSNSISDISALSGLTSLTTLCLSDNSISDISALEDLTALTGLFLWGNSISDYGPLRRLKAAIEASGNSLSLDITIPAGAPSHTVVHKSTSLLANFPNPFNPETWIPYQLAKPATVTITIFDVRGRVVRTLILGNQPAGIYRSRSKAAHWDGKNAFGEKVAGGMYFYMLTAGEFTATRKMLIRK